MASAKQSQQKVALVTGGAARIGRAICEALHQQGYRIIVHYRNSASAAQTVCDALNAERADSAIALQADLSDPVAARELGSLTLASYGRIDLLVNNASSFYATPFAKASVADWQNLFGSNVQGPYFLCQSLAAELGHRRGSIINITDIHADKPLPEHSIYGMAKAALLMMTRALAQELAPEVRVNAIAPGAILWPSDDGLLSEDSEQREILARTPMASIGEPLDIARTALFLAEHAPFITGQVINVDGGRTLSV